MGGEKRFASASLDAYWGSPPRRREKGISYVLVSEELGITPAWAGKSARVHGSRSSTRDHPRMGGEKQNPFEFNNYSKGSTPHGRGKVGIYRPLR